MPSLKETKTRMPVTAEDVEILSYNPSIAVFAAYKVGYNLVKFVLSAKQNAFCRDFR